MTRIGLHKYSKNTNSQNIISVMVSMIVKVTEVNFYCLYHS